MNKSDHSFFRIILLLLFAGISAIALAGEHSLEHFLPAKTSLPQWKQEYSPEYYHPDNLFQYINGEAELYRDYGFRRVITVPYIHRDSSDLSFIIDIYDMGTPLNAFGIYSAGRRPDQNFGTIGVESVISRTSVRFYQNRYYVQVQAGALDDMVSGTIKTAASLVAERLPAGDRPPELILLPKGNRMPHSIKFIRKGFMGQEAFNAVLQADYTFPDGTCTGFVGWFSSRDEALKAITQWESNLQERGTVSNSYQSTPSAVIRGEAPYQGKITAKHEGQNVIGVVGYERAETERQLLEQLLKQIQSKK